MSFCFLISCVCFLLFFSLSVIFSTIRFFIFNRLTSFCVFLSLLITMIVGFLGLFSVMVFYFNLFCYLFSIFYLLINFFCRFSFPFFVFFFLFILLVFCRFCFLCPFYNHFDFGLFCLLPVFFFSRFIFVSLHQLGLFPFLIISTITWLNQRGDVHGLNSLSTDQF